MAKWPKTPKPPLAPLALTRGPLHLPARLSTAEVRIPAPAQISDGSRLGAQGMGVRPCRAAISRCRVSSQNLASRWTSRVCFAIRTWIGKPPSDPGESRTQTRKKQSKVALSHLSAGGCSRIASFAGLQNLGLRAEGLGLHKRLAQGFIRACGLGLRDHSFRAGGFGSGFTAWSRLSPLSGEDFLETSRQRVRAGGVVSVEIREVEYI